MLAGEGSNNGKCRGHETRTLHTLTVMPHCKKTADTQMAHLVFADTQSNTEKPKEPFFANAQKRQNRVKNQSKHHTE